MKDKPVNYVMVCHNFATMLSNAYYRNKSNGEKLLSLLFFTNLGNRIFVMLYSFYLNPCYAKSN